MKRKLLTVALLLTMTAGLTTAQPTDSSVDVEIEVQENGDAVWTITNEVTLDTESERQSFDELINNQTELNSLADSTTERFRNFADRASQQIDREMNVNRQSVDAEREGDTGRLTVEFTWTNFAESTDGEVVVGDVFQGGFSLDEGQTLTVTGPYSNVDLDASAGETRDSSAVWTGLVDVNDDVTITFSQEDESGDGQGLPGFGVAATILALLAFLLAARIIS